MNNILITLTPAAFAQDLIPCPDGTMADPTIGCAGTPVGLLNPEMGIGELIMKIANISLTGVIAIATALLIYGGIRYAMALGDEEKLHQSKRILFWSVIGLIISLAAKIIIQYVTTLIA